jgi:inhibitor of cysteine peptidase
VHHCPDGRSPRAYAAAVTRLVGVLVVALLVLVACGSDNDDSVTVYRSGDSVSAGNGSKFMIELEANPTTGYSWQLSAPPGDQVSLIDQDYTPTGQQQPGSGGVQQFTFEAKTAGKTTLAFDYVRPWEKDVAPAQTATFPVTVT